MPIDKSKILKNAAESSLYQYPYQNRFIEDMAGEIWNPLPGYDHAFISNLGRVKNYSKNSRGRILAQRLYTQGEKPLLAFKISVNGIEKEYRTAAMVYQAFIGKLDFKKYNIAYKDGNSLNLEPSNLLPVKRWKQTKLEERQTKELNIAATASMYKYPYQNLSLVDIDGEEWRPMPGLEAYYEVSNKGRIKALERRGKKKNGTKMNHSSRIMKQRIQHLDNRFLKETSSFLSICVYAEEKKREFMVSRLVYAAFVEPFDMENLYLVVRHKDDDSLNNLPENLYLTDKGDVTKYILENNRRERNPGCSNPNKWTPEEWRQFHDFKMKPVSQYDSEGNYIRTFKSRQEAAESIGVTPSIISANTKGKAYCIKNYYWRDGESTAKLSGIRKRKTYHPFGHKITAKYNAETGELIKTYSSLTEAANDIQIPAAMLSKTVLSGKIRENILWKYFEKGEDIPEKIPIPENAPHIKKYNLKKREQDYSHRLAPQH
ncbi:MAG: hypothetical protein LBV72_00720 [Tannerella sp.]|jgi:hypothetical protein|nr:hypothetical protein [Tannerella sp.]